MSRLLSEKELLNLLPESLLPSVSVDCVIFGFKENKIQILLSRFKSHKHWMLPGGFVFSTEGIESAANRILHERTSIKDCYLQQFHTFGEQHRTDIEENKEILTEYKIDNQESHWFLQRFISIGYYAFVDYNKVKIKAKASEECQWFSLTSIPQLYGDHHNIISKALQSLRIQINYIPIGIDLLPEKFTISELRVIYETILNKKLDRRNFQRKIISNGLIDKLDETSKKWGVKDTALFTFNRDKYMEALQNGISFF